MATRHTKQRSTASSDPERQSLDEKRADAKAVLTDAVSESDADGVVVGLSGGIDSATTAALAVDALGAGSVTALLMPTPSNAVRDTDDARAFAEALGIDHYTVNLGPALDVFKRHVAPRIAPAGDEDAVGNLAARLRMACLYFVADATDAVVVGTSNRTERLLGYFTKYGDGAADVFPLARDDKTTVRALARHIGVPAHIIEKRPTAGFWDGQFDEIELGASYHAIDHVLREYLDEDRSAVNAARSVTETTVAPETAARQLARVDQTTHKRQPLPMPTRQFRAGVVTSTDDADANDVRTVADAVSSFVRSYVEETRASRLVVALDGTTESSVAAALAAEAVGPERVYGLHLPCFKQAELQTPPPSAIAGQVGIDLVRVQIRPLVTELEASLPSTVVSRADAADHRRLVSRVRLACSYYVANTSSSLVVGTTTQTDNYLGNVTSYGETFGDVHPLGNLYQSEVCHLAEQFALPTAPSDRQQPLADGATAERCDPNLSPERIDMLLHRLVDQDLGIKRTARALGLDEATVSHYASRHANTRSRRVHSPIADSHTDYFYELELAFDEAA